MEMEAWLRLLPIHMAYLNTSQRPSMCHICQFAQFQIACQKAVFQVKHIFKAKCLIRVSCLNVFM